MSDDRISAEAEGGKGSKRLAWVEGLAFAFGIAAGVLAVVGDSSKAVLGVTSVVALGLGGVAELWFDSSLRAQSGRLQLRVLLAGVVVAGTVVGLGLTTGDPSPDADPDTLDATEGEQAGKGSPSSTASASTTARTGGNSSTTTSAGGRLPGQSSGEGPGAPSGTSAPGPPETGSGGGVSPTTPTAPGTAPATTAPPTTRPPTTAPPGPTWTEQQGSLGADTFLDPTNASGKGQKVPAWGYVEVTCKVHAPQIGSANPDGYWYRLASHPWNGNYYAVANTFWNGDVPGQPPYDNSTDWDVPDC